MVAYGLFDVVTFTGGTAQTAAAATALPLPINGQPDVSATVNFSDGCYTAGAITCGSFNPPSAVTDSNCNASTIYTVPQHAGTYTLTLSDPTKTSFGTVTTTATPGAAVKIIAYSGTKQTSSEGSALAEPIIVQAQGAYKNGISGVTVNFTVNNGAVPNPSSVVTGSNGLASTTLQLGRQRLYCDRDRQLHRLQECRLSRVLRCRNDCQHCYSQRQESDRSQWHPIAGGAHPAGD